MWKWLRTIWGNGGAEVPAGTTATATAAPPEHAFTDRTGIEAPIDPADALKALERLAADAANGYSPPDDVTALLARWARQSVQGLHPMPGQDIEARYDAAQTEASLKNHWQMSDALSADAANSFHVRKILRERSRYEFANNSYLCGIGRTLANDVIGRGPRLQMITDNERINSRIEKLWKAWAKEIKLAKKLRIARESQARDGEVFLLFITNKRLKGPVKLDVQVVECDQVEDYFFIPTPEQPVSGMELDENAIPVKYHVLKVHPGSAVLWASNPYEFDKIEAEFVIHMFKGNRPGQHRGIPECSSSLSLFAILRAYTMATLNAARIVGTMNFAIGTDSNQVPPARITNVPAFTPLNIPPGTIPLLPQGYKTMQSDMQRPVAGFGEFSDQIVNEAARPISMPRNIATGNSSDYNFSSAKMDKATYYNAVGIDQHDIGEDVVDPVLFAFLAELDALGELELLEGEEPLGEFEQWEHEWEWDSPDPIDEEKTANADAKNLVTGKLALGPSDLIRMTQTARYLGLTLEQYQQLIVKNAFFQGLMAQGAIPAVSPAATANAATPGQPAPSAATPASAGEFASTSRLQWQRSQKAINDLLDQFSTGSITFNRALVLLQTLGLTAQSARALLDDINEPAGDPVSTGGNAAVTV